jgi:hypothetical protein
MAGREGEVPALNQDALTRSQVLREPMYSRLLAMYRRGAHGGGNVCLNKLPGVNPADLQLALEGSRPDNVQCPEGFRISLSWPFCCIRDGVVEPRTESNFTPYAQHEPGRKQRKGLEGDRQDPRDDEDAIYRFGKVYRTLRPNASNSLVKKKYRAYLRLLKSYR